MPLQIRTATADEAGPACAVLYPSVRQRWRDDRPAMTASADGRHADLTLSAHVDHHDLRQADALAPTPPRSPTP